MHILNCVIVLVLTKLTIAKAPINVTIFIRGQDTKDQSQLYRNLKENLIQQSFELQPTYSIKVHVLHEILNFPGDWTIHNLIPQLMLRAARINKHICKELLTHNTRWVIFCEDSTRINIKLLMERLKNENHTQPIYLGHPLYDREPTIIHHFAFFENPKWFPYTMLQAGVVLSMPLFKRIADIYINHNNNKRLEEHLTLLNFKHRSEFSIDAAHELARFIYDNVQISAETGTIIIEINYYNRPHFKIYHPNIKTTTATISSRTTANIPISSFPNTDDDGVATIISDMPHSDFFNNEIVYNLKGEKLSSTSGNITKRQKIILKKASYICPKATWETGNINSKDNTHNNENCVMFADEQGTATSSMTCTPAKSDHVYFAVKTCSKYHNERLPIIQSTWAQYAKHIKYFSDVQDDTIPTINAGLPNVEMGHCAKTLQILKLALRDIENYNNNYQDIENNNLHHDYQAEYKKGHQIQWLFLVDDDTLLSISGVCQVLGYFDSNDDIYLGERYGYRLYAQDGFNYITGGGGIVFSLSVVKLILLHCSCPSPSAPDDMMLGSCLHSLGLKALHSSRFHQARPNDYPLALLELQPPVSFHKFWQLDPIEVYNRWFLSQDRLLLAKEQLQNTMASKNYHHKNRKTLAKSEDFNLIDMPVSLVASLHHSKERHIDL